MHATWGKIRGTVALPPHIFSVRPQHVTHTQGSSRIKKSGQLILAGCGRCAPVSTSWQRYICTCTGGARHTRHPRCGRAASLAVTGPLDACGKRIVRAGDSKRQAPADCSEVPLVYAYKTHNAHGISHYPALRGLGNIWHKIIGARRCIRSNIWARSGKRQSYFSSHSTHTRRKKKGPAPLCARARPGTLAPGRHWARRR